MKGRKTKPDALKVLSGTNQPVRMNGSGGEFKKISKVPTYPNYLNRSGKKIYKTIAQAMIYAGILNEVNVFMLISYCHSMGVHYDCEKELGEVNNRVHDRMSANFGKYTQVKALHKVSQDALKQAKVLASEFGITPAAQARLKFSVVPEDDPFDHAMR
jgi:P27 family predicted phage terminase small subunit